MEINGHQGGIMDSSYEGQLGYRSVAVVWIKNVETKWKNVILKSNIFEMWKQCVLNMWKMYIDAWNVHILSNYIDGGLIRLFFQP